MKNTDYKRFDFTQCFYAFILEPRITNYGNYFKKEKTPLRTLKFNVNLDNTFSTSNKQKTSNAISKTLPLGKLPYILCSPPYLNSVVAVLRISDPF